MKKNKLEIYNKIYNNSNLRNNQNYILGQNEIGLSINNYLDSIGTPLEFNLKNMNIFQIINLFLIFMALLSIVFFNQYKNIIEIPKYFSFLPAIFLFLIIIFYKLGQIKKYKTNYNIIKIYLEKGNESYIIYKK